MDPSPARLPERVVGAGWNCLEDPGPSTIESVSWAQLQVEISRAAAVQYFTAAPLVPSYHFSVHI